MNDNDRTAYSAHNFVLIVLLGYIENVMQCPKKNIQGYHLSQMMHHFSVFSVSLRKILRFPLTLEG